MSVNDAVALRFGELLAQNKMSQYKIMKKTGLSTSRLSCIMRSKNKTVTLSTVMLLSQGFGMTVAEFLTSPIFEFAKLEVE